MATPAATGAATPANETSLPLTPEILQRLYEWMLRCRMVEGRAAFLARQGRVPRFRPRLGREAIDVGATIDLQPEDSVAPSPRAFVAQVVRGAPLTDVFARLGHTIDVSTAVQVQLATGMAVSASGKSQVVLALVSGQASPWREWSAAVDFASQQKLPVVYVFEGDPPRRPKPSRGKASIPEIVVDGGDVIAVFRVAREAIHHARLGRGPSLVHCVPFVPRGARRAQDPLEHIELYLQKHGLWTKQHKQELVERCEREIADAVRGLKKKRK